MRILDFGKCSPYGTAKGGERFAKGGSWELLFSTTCIYIYIYIYTYINICTMYTVHTHTDFIRGIKKVEKIFECTHIISMIFIYIHIYNYVIIFACCFLIADEATKKTPRNLVMCPVSFRGSASNCRGRGLSVAEIRNGNVGQAFYWRTSPKSWAMKSLNTFNRRIYTYIYGHCFVCHLCLYVCRLCRLKTH